MRAQAADTTVISTMHQRLRRAALAVILAAVFVALFAPAVRITIPRWVGFRIVMGVLLVANVGWWTIADEWLARNLTGPRRTVLRWLAIPIMLILVWPLLHMVISGRGDPLTSL